MRSLAIGICVFALSLMRSLADGFGMADESWFLQVVHRLRAGDVLYRDVSYPAPPFAVYLTTLLSYPLGIEIVIVKIVTNAAFALTVVLVERLIRRAGLSIAGSCVVMGLLILWARPYGNPPYTPVAMAMFVSTLALTFAALTADGRGDRGEWNRSALLSIGLLAGLSFAAKQNIGALALGAALLAPFLVAADRSRAVRAGVSVSAGFAVTVGLLLLPVLVSGGLPGLWDYGAAAKGIYIQRGSVSYLANMSEWAHNVANLPSPSAAVGVVHGLALVLPIVVAVSAVWRWRSLDTAARLLLVFDAAAIMTAFPRWDRFHMGYAIPVHLAALVTMWRPALTAAMRDYWTRFLPVAAVVLLTVAVAGPVTAAARGTLRPSALPHFRGPLASEDTDRRLAKQARALADASGGEPMFVLSTDAGFWYLVSGVRNPMPFDIPAVASVGRWGVEAILARLSGPSPMAVCVDNRPPTPLELSDVEAFVLEHMQRGPDVGPCTVYRARAAAARIAGTRDE